MKVLVFDLETRANPSEVGWKNFSAHGISFGCAYIYELDEYRIYGENDIHMLIMEMQDADLIVGFNIISFDMPLVRATFERVSGEPMDAALWDSLMAKCYDILDDIREALGTQYAKNWRLDQVAQSNITISKNGDGAEAPNLWKSGNYSKLATYVIQDVKVEKSLWEYVLKHGEVRNDFTTPSPLKLNQIKKFQKTEETATA